jgi:hypothetical protein
MQKLKSNMCNMDMRDILDLSMQKNMCNMDMRDILDLSQFYVVAMVILFILMFFLPYRM